MKLVLIFAGCLALIVLISANPSAARYDDFKVYRIAIKGEQQFDEFKKLGDNLPLRLLTEPRGPGFSYDVVIDPVNQDKLEAQLRLLELDYSCVIEDLQSVLEVESQSRSSFLRQPTEMSWTEYHQLPVIYKWLIKLKAEFPDIVKSYVIGESYEERPIRALKISSKPGNKAIFIESNIHAIEWISSATTTCFINNLLRSSDPRMKHLLENYDWIYVPVLNPDGFEYSHNVERLWRKNRKPTGFHNSSGPCYGTDLNRNFGYEWGNPVSGAAKDWAYGVKKVPFAATMELRDRGQYGFFLPPNQILEVCAEVTDGLITMVARAQEEGLFD